MGAGHASTSMGYAVGIKEGMRHCAAWRVPARLGQAARRTTPRGCSAQQDSTPLEQPPEGKVVAVIGDGAMTGGVAFEAIGQAGGSGDADRSGAERQRDVDRAQRGRAIAVLQPRALAPKAVARPRGCGGRPCAPAGEHWRGVRAPRPAAEGVDQGVLGAGPVVGGARLGLHGGDRRPRRARAARGAARGAGGGTPRGGAHRDGQGQGLRAG